jgi:hypothetical protein
MPLSIKYPDRTADYEEQITGNVQKIIGTSLAFAVTGLGVGSLTAGSWAGSGIMAITAMACYIIGGGFGFLFSIPRSAQESGKNPSPNATGTNAILIPRDNTNLEQISD